MDKERVQKIISNAGLCSRRKAEKHIANGDVTVNGKPITLGDKATKKDNIKVKGEELEFDKRIYLALHKPKNVLSTLSTPSNKQTITDYIGISERVYPCGRLDYDAEGLIILTNDGDFANTIMHPKYEKQKEYVVVTTKPITIPSTPHTVTLDDGDVTVHTFKKEGENTYALSIHEGRNHIVKRICKTFNADVERLIRTRIGSVTLDIEPGKSRKLTKKEVKSLRE